MVAEMITSEQSIYLDSFLIPIICDWSIFYSFQTIEYKYLADYTNPCWLDDRELRCLPHFYVIGVGRSGTTMVYKLLTKHQNVVKPRRKELAMWQDITKRKLNSSTNQKCRKHKTNA